MTVRTLGVSALLAATLLAGPALARDPDPLANLIKAAAQEPNPVMAFLHGFADGGDVELDKAAIRKALVEANLTSGPLSEVLWATNGITKKGTRLELDRSSKTKIPLAGGHLRLGKTVKLDIERRPLADVEGKDAERVAGAEGHDYIKIENTKGLKVSKSGKWYSFFKMDDVFAFQEGGAPTVVFHAGPRWIGKWVKKSLAKAPAEDAVIVPEQGQAPAQDAVIQVEQDQPGAAGALGDATGATKPQDEVVTKPQDEVVTKPQDEVVTKPVAVEPPADPEEKKRIDDEVKDFSADTRKMTDEVKKMVELWKKDRDESRRQLEARIRQLNEETKALQQEIAELTRRLSERDRMRNQLDPYGTRVNMPGYDPRAIRRDRYDPITGRPIEDTRIDPVTGRPVQPKKESKLMRLLKKILEGVAKGLQDRFSKSADDNANARANALALGTAPANRPYVGASLGNAGLVPVANTPIVRVNNTLNTRRTLNLPLGYHLVPVSGARPAVNNNRRVPVASTPILPAGNGGAVIKR